jgi:hypothetical protein
VIQAHCQYTFAGSAVFSGQPFLPGLSLHRRHCKEKLVNLIKIYFVILKRNEETAALYESAVITAACPSSCQGIQQGL